MRLSVLPLFSTVLWIDVYQARFWERLLNREACRGLRSRSQLKSVYQIDSPFKQAIMT